jgi:hypothetical protein
MSFFHKHHASRVGITQTIAYDSSVAATNAFGVETYQLRLVADSACCYRIGDGAQTATNADTYLPANAIEYVIVTPGQRSPYQGCDQWPGDATAGTLWVDEQWMAS